MNVIGVIPCRYNSSRFPGKSIALISGEPMLLHVYRRAREARLIDRLVIATDDDRIARVATDNDLEVVMTSNRHPTGTDRVAEVSSILEGDLFVNVQGDEPMIDPRGIDSVVSAALEFPNLSVFNGYTCIGLESQINDLNTVKVIADLEENALAFSRLGIPHPKEDSFDHKRQLGLYGIKRSAIQMFPNLQRGPLERSEGVEMYRFLENGIPIKMVQVTETSSVAVDVPEDIPKVEQLLNRRKYFE